MEILASGYRSEVSLRGATNHAMTILSPYSATIGAAISVNVAGSPVGVRTAATIKMMRIAYFVLRAKNLHHNACS